MFWVIFWHPYLSREVNFYFNQDKKTKTKWNYFGDVQGSQMLSFCHIRGVFTMCFFFFLLQDIIIPVHIWKQLHNSQCCIALKSPHQPLSCWMRLLMSLRRSSQVKVAFDFRGTWRYASTLRSSVGPRAFVAHTHWNGLALPLHVAKCSEKMP